MRWIPFQRELVALPLLLCCCGTFLLADKLKEHEKAIARIKKRGGEIAEAIQGGKKSITVDMKGTELLGNEIALFDGLIGLEELDLRATNINGAGLAHLKQHKNLKRLYLSNVATEPGLGARPLIHLKVLRVLEELQLGAMRLTDKDLADLAEITTLKKINLYSNRISDRGIAYLKKLTALEWLDLSHNRIGDAGLTNLKQLKNLKYLDLNGTRVSDKGLKHLEGLNNLRDIDLFGTSVTKAGVKQLQQALPKIKILFEE